jgi:hypothetical protein
VVAGLVVFAGDGQAATSTSSQTWTFDEDLEGWDVSRNPWAHNKNCPKGGIVSSGTGEWSSKHSGSARLHVNGAPEAIGASTPVDGLKQGAEITATYKEGSPPLDGEAGHFDLWLMTPGCEKIRLDQDQGRPDKDSQQVDGELRGTVPRDMPDETRLRVHLQGWPINAEVFVDSVEIDAAPSDRCPLSFEAGQLGDPWQGWGDVDRTDARDSSDALKIVDRRSTHGDNSLYLSSQGDLDRFGANFTADLTRVSALELDAYVESGNPYYGGIRITLDGHNHRFMNDEDGPGALSKPGNPEGQWMRNIDGDLSDVSGSHSIVFWAWGRNNAAYFDDIRFVGQNGSYVCPLEDTDQSQPPSPPTNLTVSPTDTTNEAELSWQSPSTDDPSAPSSFEITRIVDGDAEETFTVDASTRSFVDQAAPCRQPATYEVVAVNDHGESDPARATLEPHHRSDLLCQLNDRFDFYWGPVTHDDSMGAPDAPPESLDTIRDRAVDENRPANWFVLDPARLACCETIEADANTLSEEGYDFEVDPARQLERLLGEDPSSDLAKSMIDDKLGNLVEAKAEFDGFRGVTGRLADADYTPLDRHPPIGDHPSVAGQTGTEFTAPIGCGPATATADLEGTMYLDPGEDSLELSPPDKAFVSLEKEFCPIEWDPDDFEQTVPMEKGPVSSIGVTAGVNASLTPTAAGSLGGRLETGTLNPQYLAGDVSAHGKAEGVLNASTDLRGWLGFRAETNVTADGGFEAELVVPTNEDPVDVNAWPQAEVTYQDVSSPVLVLYAGPFELALERPRGNLTIGDEYEKEIALPLAQEGRIDRKAFAFGEATVEAGDATVDIVNNGETDDGDEGLFGIASVPASPAPRDSAAAVVEDWERFDSDPEATDTSPVGESGDEFGTDSHDPTAKPGTQSMTVRVDGTPGDIVDVTVERPIAVPADGEYAVEDWTVTIPNVEIGPEGTALLSLDTAQVQHAVQHVTNHTDASVNESVDEVNRKLDANGDGLPDLQARQAAFDNRVPTRTDLVDVETADGTVPTGRLVSWSARVQTAPAGNTPGPTGDRGTVTLAVGDHVVSSAPVGPDGVARGEGFVPAEIDEGSRIFRAEYSGTDDARASTGIDAFEVEDQAPNLQVASPTPGAMQVVNATSGHELDVTASVTPTLDLPLGPAQYRIDDRSWQPLSSAGLWTYAEGIDLREVDDLEEGVHELRVQVEDWSGHAAERTVTFVYDEGPANVTTLHTDAAPKQAQASAETPEPIVVGADEPIRLAWHGDEPVAVKGVLEEERVREPATPNETETRAGLDANDTRPDRGEVREPTWTRVLEDKAQTFAEQGSVVFAPPEVGVYRIHVEAVDTARHEAEAIAEQGPFPVIVVPEARTQSAEAGADEQGASAGADSQPLPPVESREETTPALGVVPCQLDLCREPVEVTTPGRSVDGRCVGFACVGDLEIQEQTVTVAEPVCEQRPKLCKEVGPDERTVSTPGAGPGDVPATPRVNETVPGATVPGCTVDACREGQTVTTPGIDTGERCAGPVCAPGIRVDDQRVAEVPAPCAQEDRACGTLTETDEKNVNVSSRSAPEQTPGPNASVQTPNVSARADVGGDRSEEPTTQSPPSEAPVQGACDDACSLGAEPEVRARTGNATLSADVGDRSVNETVGGESVHVDSADHTTDEPVRVGEDEDGDGLPAWVSVFDPANGEHETVSVDPDDDNHTGPERVGVPVPDEVRVETDENGTPKRVVVESARVVVDPDDPTSPTREDSDNRTVELPDPSGDAPTIPVPASASVEDADGNGATDTVIVETRNVTVRPSSPFATTSEGPTIVVENQAAQPVRVTAPTGLTLETNAEPAGHAVVETEPVTLVPGADASPG